MWVWPQQMTRASVRDDALEDDVRVERPGRSPGVCEPGRGVADEDQRVVGAAGGARTGSRRSQSSRSSPSSSWAHSAAARIGVRDAVGHPRERRRVVEVGDGDVGVALRRSSRPRPPSRAGASTVPAGSGPLSTRSPATSDARPASRLRIAARDRRRARRRCRGRRRGRRSAVIASTPCGRDDEAERRLAGDLAVDAWRPPGRVPNRPPSFSIVTSSRSVSPGTDDPLEAAVVDPGEQPDPVAEARLLGHVDGHRLGERLDLEDARHDRQAREVALEEPLGRGHALDPDDPLRLRRRTRRSGRRAGTASGAGSAPRSRGSYGLALGHGRLLDQGGGQCRRGGAARAAQVVCRSARRAPRLTLAPRRRGTPRCRRGRAGSSSSGPRGTSRSTSSAWWIAMFVTRPSTTSSSRATRPRAIAVAPVRAPDDRACRAASRRTAGPRSRRTGASPSGRPGRPGAW